MKNTTENFKNVLSRLREIGFEDYESIAAIKSIVMQHKNTNGLQIKKSGKRTYQLILGEEVYAEISFNRDYKLYEIKIPEKLWETYFTLIERDINLNEIRIARSVIFSYRHLKGYVLIPQWLQLRPVAYELKDKTGFGALNLADQTYCKIEGLPIPLVIEVVYRYSDLHFLKKYRHSRALQEARWLLSAFIDVPIFELNHPYFWALLEGTFQLVRCDIQTGLEDTSEKEFSDVKNLPELIPIPNSQYFSELGIYSKEFRIPQLKELYEKYVSFPIKTQLLFLRSCASLWEASNPLLSESHRLVALVTAIEPLLEKPKRCDKCGQVMGITRQFEKFLNKYVKPPKDIEDIFKSIYETRSEIVHGRRNLEVDRMPLMNLQDTILSAWISAKRGVINWFLSQ